MLPCLSQVLEASVPRVAMTRVDASMGAPAARIVLVEDDPDLRELFQDLLVGDGRQFDAFGDAESAIRHLANGPCELVITDYRLPGMSGLELADQVHADRPQTWVIVASGAELPTLRPSTRRLRYMMKPFSIEELLRRVEEYTVGA